MSRRSRNSWIEDLSDDSDGDGRGYESRRVNRTFGHQPSNKPQKTNGYAPRGEPRYNGNAASYYSSDESQDENDFSGSIGNTRTTQRRSNNGRSQPDQPRHHPQPSFENIVIKQPIRNHSRKGTNSSTRAFTGSRDSSQFKGFVPRGINSTLSNNSYDDRIDDGNDGAFRANSSGHQGNFGGSGESNSAEVRSGREHQTAAVPWVNAPKKFLGDVETAAGGGAGDGAGDPSTRSSKRVSSKSSRSSAGASDRTQVRNRHDEEGFQSDESAHTVEAFGDIPSEGRVTATNRAAAASRSSSEALKRGSKNSNSTKNSTDNNNSNRSHKRHDECITYTATAESGHGPAHASTFDDEEEEDRDKYYHRGNNTNEEIGSLNGPIGPRISGSLLHDDPAEHGSTADLIPRLKSLTRGIGNTTGSSGTPHQLQKNSRSIRRAMQPESSAGLHPLRQPREALPQHTASRLATAGGGDNEDDEYYYDDDDAGAADVAGVGTVRGGGWITEQCDEEETGRNCRPHADRTASSTATGYNRGGGGGGGSNHDYESSDARSVSSAGGGGAASTGSGNSGMHSNSSPRKGAKKTYHSKAAVARARSSRAGERANDPAPPLLVDNRPPPSFSSNDTNSVPQTRTRNSSAGVILEDVGDLLEQENIYGDNNNNAIASVDDAEHNPMATIRYSFVHIAHPKGRRTEHVQCTIIRERSTFQDKLYPTYTMVLEETGKTLIIAKKMNMNRTSNYHLFDMTRGQLSSKLSKKSGNYIGKLRSKNMNRTDYVLMNQHSEKEEIAGVRFDRLTLMNQLKDGNQPRKMKVMVPPLDVGSSVPIPNRTQDGEAGSLAEKLNHFESAKRHGKKYDLLVFETKDPVFENGNYRLNFNGRVSMPSVKNFQMVAHDNINDIICQFGKVEEDVFHLDYKAPFNACQAFAFALCQFNL